MNLNLKADLEQLVKERMESYDQKMIEQEKANHEQFLTRHFEKYDVLSERHKSYISQLITLEGVILGALVIFTNPQQMTIWLISAVCFILFSLIFGIWRQTIAIQSDFQSHEWNYYQKLKSHWWSRESLWNDQTVKTEKEIFGSHLKDPTSTYTKTLQYKLLKLLKLDADKVEAIFVVSLILALALLMLHLLFKAPSLITSIPT